MRRLTYRELRDEVCRCANALKSLGVRRGDVVAIHLPNLPEAFVAIHACNRIGAIYTVLVQRLCPGRDWSAVAGLACRRRHHRRWLLSPGAHGSVARQSPRGTQGRPTAAPHAGREPHRRRIELAAERNRLGRAAGIDAHRLSLREDGGQRARLSDFHVGNESKPKGVVHSTAGFLVGTWANVQWQVGPEPDDVYWCAADVGWLTFPIQAVTGGLAHGITLFCYEGALDYPEQTRLLDSAKRHGVTKILVAPTGLRMLRAAGDDA